MIILLSNPVKRFLQNIRRIVFLVTVLCDSEMSLEETLFLLAKKDIFRTQVALGLSATRL
jgi:hypothetical protein